MLVAKRIEQAMKLEIVNFKVMMESKLGSSFYIRNDLIGSHCMHNKIIYGFIQHERALGE